MSLSTPAFLSSPDALLLADSELAGVTPGPDQWRLRLSAAQVQRADETGYQTGLTLVLLAPQAAPAVALAAQVRGRIAHGRWGATADEAAPRAWVSRLPLEGAGGPGVLELTLGDGTALCWRVLGWALSEDPQGRFRPSCAC
ncbi:hypothetical protein [Ideonella livida]|uniref:Uncharacterized protein n=1 Tax=Ideonella livida TaxID=2707176 RepID=A0A7C9TNK1_9BURK|nr:hypothetical protein [Ideonella livida]NDY93943.1 hypothetical protein [Ideonella livida]